MDGDRSNHNTARALRELLLELAKGQDDLATAEAATTPYWEPHPTTVAGRRAAARILREQAACLIAA